MTSGAIPTILSSSGAGRLVVELGFVAPDTDTWTMTLQVPGVPFPTIVGPSPSYAAALETLADRVAKLVAARDGSIDRSGTP